MSDRNNADPGLFTILNQVVDGLATRLQIASIELSVGQKQRGQRQPFTLSLPPFSASLRSFLYRSHFLLFSGKITAFSSPAASQALICSCSFSS